MMSDFVYEDDKKYISFSQVELFNECSWRWKLRYINKIKLSNIFLVFGNSVHETIEYAINNKNEKIDYKKKFQERWNENFSAFLTEEYVKKESKKKSFIDTCKHMYKNGPILCQEAAESIAVKFPGWEILFVELPLQEQLSEEDDLYYYIGKIDLVLTNGERIIIIDWKTASWGWDARKRGDKMKHYQLMLYKHFYAKKFDIDVDLIDCYFSLVKRTAKKDRIEFILVEGGPKKIKNSLNIVNNVVYNIRKEKYIKNFQSCKFCPFRKTEHCPGS